MEPDRRSVNRLRPNVPFRPRGVSTHQAWVRAGQPRVMDFHVWIDAPQSVISYDCDYCGLQGIGGIEAENRLPERPHWPECCPCHQCSSPSRTRWDDDVAFYYELGEPARKYD
jgi:hypothetical protein